MTTQYYLFSCQNSGFSVYKTDDNGLTGQSLTTGIEEVDKWEDDTSLAELSEGLEEDMDNPPEGPYTFEEVMAYLQKDAESVEDDEESFLQVFLKATI